MNDADLLSLYEEHLRRDAFFPGMTVEKRPEVTRYLDPSGREGEIMWHRFDAGQAEGVVSREMAFFSKGFGRLHWKIYTNDLPAGLPAILERHGMTCPQVEKVMVAGAADTARRLSTGPDPRLRMLQKPGEIADLAGVWESVWPGLTEAWSTLLAGELRPESDRVRVLVAMHEGRPASAGYILLDRRKSFAYLGGGSTIQACRGLGLYRALVAERARIAAAAGIDHLAVEASPASAPILSKLGFRSIADLRIYERKFR